MKQPVVIIGLGEMGGVFARAFLKMGLPVYPVVRGMDWNEVADEIPEPCFVLLAVAEKDLHPALATLPAAWKAKLVLLQNELLPPDWLKYSIIDPTVMAVWFEKKKGQDIKVLRETPVFGPNALLIKDSLALFDIPVRLLGTSDELEFELVKKCLFVFTINIAGLVVGGTTGELLGNHKDLTLKISNEVIGVLEILTGKSLLRERLTSELLDAIQNAPDHKCRGRAAPERLARLLAHARANGVDVPVLKAILTQ